MNARIPTPAIALVAALGLLLGATAQAATPATGSTADKPAAAASAAKKPRSAQQEKMSSCSKQAKGKRGDERRAFMSSCLSKAPAASAAK